MKITSEMKIQEVLAIDESLINAMTWLSPAFERLKYPELRQAMGNRVSIEQAARVAHLPVNEMLYVLNLAAGEDEETISQELQARFFEDFNFSEINWPTKPLEIINLKDDDPKVVFVDLMPFHEAKCDPMQAIAKALIKLREPDGVLLLRHPFDPIPLRDMLAHRGLSSWAEERKEGEWFVYFYHPDLIAKASADLSVGNKALAKTMAACA
jgi:hypothetical protein